jgi:hypothetical protein
MATNLLPLLFVGIGLGAGILSGVFGIGGGIVIVPALVFLAKMDMKTATGTSLGALLLPVGILGAYTYWKGGYVDAKAALLVAGGLFVGVLFGSRIATHFDNAVLQRGFAVLLLLVAVRMFFLK